MSVTKDIIRHAYRYPIKSEEFLTVADFQWIPPKPLDTKFDVVSYEKKNPYAIGHASLVYVGSFKGCVKMKSRTNTSGSTQKKSVPV